MLDRGLSNDSRDDSVALENLAVGLGDAARQYVLSRSGAKSRPIDGRRVSPPAKRNHGVGGGAAARSAACGEFEGTSTGAAGCISNVPGVRWLERGSQCDRCAKFRILSGIRERPAVREADLSSGGW